MPGLEFFSRQYRSKVIFFAGPSKAINIEAFATSSCLIMVSATTMCLIHAFTTNSGFCHKFTLNLGFRDNCTLQEEQPDSFIVNLTLFLGYLANFTLRLII